MEPSIRFCRNRDGERIAYMTWGQGPVLVVPPGWVSHLELQWHYIGMRDFVERLAESLTLVFYDKRGCGLSERDRTDFSLAGELADVEVVVDEVTDGPVSVFGDSLAGPVSIAYAAAHPDRTEHLVLFGAYHKGELLAPAQVRRSLVELVRASWGLGSRALASLFVPGTADPTFMHDLARFQREAASPEMAARLLEAGYSYDVTADLGRVKAPTLVIHRRGDRAMVSRFGPEMASAIDRARLVMLEGDIHFPWLGDWEPIAQLIEDFVRPATGTGEPARRPRPAAAPASERGAGADDGRSRSMRRPYELVHYRVGDAQERSHFRVGLAQIGEAAHSFVPAQSGLYRLPSALVDPVRDKVTRFVEQAAGTGVDLLLFPEMSIDLNHPALEALLLDLTAKNDMVLVAGGYHDERSRSNVCRVFGPEGELWQQRKHIPAFLRVDGQTVQEPIVTPKQPLFVVAGTHLGHVSVAICRDFLDLELRVDLRNSEPPVDLVLNPAFTPVTADFEAAHFEARRALFATTLFCNHAMFGNSRIFSPYKDTPAITVPPREERLAFVDVPLLSLRAERSAWDAQARARFIQSTRS